MAPTPRSSSKTPKPATSPRRVGTPRPRPAASGPTRRTVALPKRRKPEPASNAKKAMGAVSSALPGLLQKAGTPAKKAKPSSRKGGAGLALAAAGAGFAALKNRDKLPAKLGGQKTPEPVTVTPVPVTPVPAEPLATTGPLTPVTPPVNDIDADGPPVV